MSDQALPPPPPLDALAPPDAGPPPVEAPPPEPPASVQLAHQAWKPRPLLGPILWAYGVGLWAFVALGQFTTEHAPWSSEVPLGGTAAALWLGAISLAGLVHALRTSFTLPSGQRTPFRIAFVTVTVLISWAFTGFVSAALASMARENIDAIMTLSLLALAITMTVLGRSSTRALTRPPQGRARLAVFALWAVGGLLTLLVLLQLG